VLCVLLTAWFDKFVDSNAAICVALRVPLSVYVLSVTCRFAGGSVDQVPRVFVCFLECCFD